MIAIQLLAFKGGEMELIIDIAKAINSPSALSREQGNIVFSLIVKSLSEGNDVVLDFCDVESIITPFLNTSIGQLYSKYSSKELSDHLKIINIPDGTAQKFNNVICNAKAFYSDNVSFKQAVEDGVNNI